MSLLRSKSWAAIFAFCSIPLAACGGHFTPAFSASAGKNALGATRHVSTTPNLFGRSADGAYQIRTLHVSGVTIHQSIATTTPNGTFTQVD